LHALLAIEKGNWAAIAARGILNGPRTVDLDLLLMGDTVIVGEELTLPHPALGLAPLCTGASGRDLRRSSCTRNATRPWWSCWPCCLMRVKTAYLQCAGLRKVGSPAGTAELQSCPNWF